MALLLCGCSENAAVHLLCSLRVCTPSFNEHSECPEEGWPAGPGRSLFTVSAIAKLVKSIGCETRPLPGQSALPLS